MAPTLVNAAFGAVLAAALLGAAFDRRSVGVVVLAAALPDLDMVASLVLTGATNALLHTLWLPFVIGVVLYWDTVVREASVVHRRAGWRGVRIAWVALAAYTVAGIGPELFGRAGVNLLYPLHDAYYLVDGRLVLSTNEGVVQTFLTAGSTGLLPLESPGTTATYTIPTWINPDGRTGLGNGERVLFLLRSGWQAVVVAGAAAVLAIRFYEGGDR